MFHTRNADGTFSAPVIAPTGGIYRNGIADGSVTVVCTQIGGALSPLFRASFTAPSGYADFDRVQIVVAYGDAGGNTMRLASDPLLVSIATTTEGGAGGGGGGGSGGATTIESRGVTVLGGV